MTPIHFLQFLTSMLVTSSSFLSSHFRNNSHMLSYCSTHKSYIQSKPETTDISKENYIEMKMMMIKKIIFLSLTLSHSLLSFLISSFLSLPTYLDTILTKHSLTAFFFLFFFFFTLISSSSPPDIFFLPLHLSCFLFSSFPFLVSTLSLSLLLFCLPSL